MTVGWQYTLTSSNCPLDHCTVQHSCRGTTRILTFLITFNNRFVKELVDEPMQIAYFINHNRMVTNFTANVYFEPEENVDPTDSSAVTFNPRPLTTATTVTTEHERSLNKIKNHACNSSLNSMYVSGNSVLILLSSVILSCLIMITE